MLPVLKMLFLNILLNIFWTLYFIIIIILFTNAKVKETFHFIILQTLWKHSFECTQNVLKQLLKNI